MRVSDVMRTDVVTAPGLFTAKEGAALMGARLVGSVVVTEAGAPIGIVTEGDLALRVVAQGRDPNATRLTDVMSRPLHTIAPTASLDDAAERMRMLRIKRLVVTDTMMRGIITTTNIAYAQPSLLKLLAERRAMGKR